MLQTAQTDSNATLAAHCWKQTTPALLQPYGVSAVHLPGNPFMVQERYSLTSNIFLLLQQNSQGVIFIHPQTQENFNTPAAVLTQCVYSILMTSQGRKQELTCLW